KRVERDIAIFLLSGGKEKCFEEEGAEEQQNNAIKGAALICLALAIEAHRHSENRDFRSGKQRQMRGTPCGQVKPENVLPDLIQRSIAQKHQQANSGNPERPQVHVALWPQMFQQNPSAREPLQSVWKAFYPALRLGHAAPVIHDEEAAKDEPPPVD